MEVPATDLLHRLWRNGWKRVRAVASAGLTDGAAGLACFGVALFSPVRPMLASPAADVADALRQLGSALFEWKIDGARVQVHKRHSEVRVYTRNLREVSASVPDPVPCGRPRT